MDFETLGLPLLAGRAFTPVEEAQETEPVAVIDRMLAERLFPGRSALGEFVQLVDFDDTPEGGPLRVVGVVPPVRNDMLSPASPHVYVPYGRHYRAGITFHVRTRSGLEAAMMTRVRDAIQGVDARLPLLALRPMTALRDGSFDSSRCCWPRRRSRRSG